MCDDSYIEDLNKLSLAVHDFLDDLAYRKNVYDIGEFSCTYVQQLAMLVGWKRDD